MFWNSKYRFPIVVGVLLIVCMMVLALGFVWDVKHIRGWNIKTVSVNTLAPGIVTGITHDNFTAGAGEQRYFRDLVFVGDTAHLKLHSMQRG
jgi:hypothetical protein